MVAPISCNSPFRASEAGATGYDRKVWESLNYFYEVDAWLPRNYIMVN